MSSEHRSLPLAGQALVNTGFVAHVLLIEDDPSYAKLVRILLDASDSLQCQTSSYSTLTEGLQALAQNEFDAILLDLNLPDSRGLNSLHRLLAAYPDSNVIVLTSSSDKEQGVLAVGSGAQDYLIKGEFEDNQLIRAVRFSIERKQILARLEEAQRVAKMGHWECRPSTNHFYASNEVYKFFSLTTAPYHISYQDLHQPECPLHPLLQLCTGEYKGDDATLTRYMTIDRSDGGSLQTVINCRRVISQDGDPIYFGTMQDISLQRQAEELQRAHDLAVETARVREQILANVSHELRTPMNIILGMSNLLGQSDVSPEQREYLHSIRDASQVLLGIINDILLSSSLQNDKLTLNPKPFKLPLSLQRITKAFEPKIKEAGLELQLSLDERLPQQVIGDKQRLSQVIFNLLGNSVKFTSEGHISLRAHLLEDQQDGKQWVRFEVEDSGIGIPAEKQKDIFQAFTRVHQPGKVVEGTGLGLTITKNLTELMGGTICLLSSTATGSIFQFTLPFEPWTAEKDAHTGPPTTRPDHVSDHTILVVEDHHMNRMVIEKTLQKKWPEARILLAKSGEEALDILKAKNIDPIDLILMDLQMPGMDGYATSTQIRQDYADHAKRVPIIAMTAQPQVANDIRFVDSGMDDFILKPFDPEELFEKLTHYLSN